MRRIGVNVLQAARRRIALALDHSERAYVSFSGGKDSTVMLHLVMEEAIRRGRRIGLLFIDLEGQYRHTIEHIERCYDLYRDHIEPYWVALPLNLRNAVSQFEPHWMCWEPGREKDWIRKRPKRAIADEAAFPFFRRGMEFEEFTPAFGEWYAQGQRTACFVGIRTQESLNRWRSIASVDKVRVNGWGWTTVQGDTFNAYPIYDWRTEDIWTFHARYPELPSNPLYDLMHRAGLTIHQQRICQPYGDDQRKGLSLFHALEPDTWAKVVARVNGANQGALYAQERGNILGVNKITRPEGHTWESFAHLLLESMPERTAEHYRNKIATFIRWWQVRGVNVIDEADPKLEAAKKAPSWRRICKALLRNDYWCKGLSFTQQSRKSESYARYNRIMRERRREWGIFSPDNPDPPSARQLALVAALTKGATPDDAYRVIGAVYGRDAAWARQYATHSRVRRAINVIQSMTDDEWESLCNGGRCVNR